MGGEVPKQFRLWGGLPLLLATVRAFQGPGMPAIQGLALAVPEDRLEEVRSWSFPFPAWTVAGGATRQESVASALALLPAGTDDVPVLIHDAVRPFPPPGPILEALAALDTWDGALLAEASTDTLKRVDPDLRVLATEPRDRIYRAQTPQVALLGTWRKAFAWAAARGVEATDDASLLEGMGLRVKVVPSPSTNLKLTLPEDWDRAQGFRPQGVVDPATADGIS
jgi:2-C-methyl-D-erythritol 4-phosphate cytidylyltransferase